MKDQFGRTIDYMRVSVTDRCNLRCIYCMPAQGVPAVSHQDILTYDEITRLCRIGAELGIRKLKLTGGEPLVRRGLPELVRMLKEIPGIEQVTLTTNGTLLKQQIRDLVISGLDAVNISIDTLDPEKYRKVTRLGDVREAVEGLKAACEIPGLKVKVNCVPLEGAEEEDYIRIARLAKDGRSDVRFIELMPMGPGKAFTGKSGTKVRSLLKETFGEPKSCEENPGNGPAVYVTFPGFRGKIGFISAITHPFCCRCNRIRLTSEGFLKPCLQYGEGTDLRLLLRSGANDALIQKAMKNAVYGKPACHQFTKSSQEEQENLETKEMSRIGG